MYSYYGRNSPYGADSYLLGYDRPRRNKYDFIGDHSLVSGRKAFEVANVIMEIAREKDIGRRWFHHFNPDLRESLSMLYPVGRHTKDEPVTKDQLNNAMKRITNWVNDERDRYDAQKERGRKIDEWESQYESRAQMAKEWELLKKEVMREMKKNDKPVRRVRGVKSASPRRRSKTGSRRTRSSSRRTRSAGGKRRRMRKATLRRRR